MLRYSDQALAVRPAFYAHRNGVTIIVEDEGKETFYTEVLARLLEGEVQIDRVMGVGGKRNVLNRWLERSSRSESVPEFYLIDGDFDDLIGKSIPYDDLLFKLERYDIESYLVEETAICTIAQEEMPTLTLIEYQEALGITNWVDQVVIATAPLAACAALLQHLGEQVIGISQTIERYVPGNQITPDPILIKHQIGLVKSGVTAVTPKQFNPLLQQMVARMGKSSAERARWVSGKDIFIPLVIRMFRVKLGKNVSKQSLCFRLAKHCIFPDLQELRERILAIA